MRHLADMLKLKRATGGWKVPVLPTVAPRDEGVAALVDACDRHAQEVGRGRRTRAPDATDTPAAQLARRFIERDGFVCHRRLELVEAGRAEGHDGRGDDPARARQFQRRLSRRAHVHVADTAFGLAANLAGFVAVGIDTHMAFHVGLREGDRLTARAYPVARGKRVATCAST